MPKFFKTDLLSSPVKDEEHQLTAPHLLDDSNHSHFSPTDSDNPPDQHKEISFADTPQSESISDQDPIRTLFSWRAPARPYRKKNRSYYTTVTILIILVAAIVFLAGQTLLVGVLFALLFVIYVLGFVPPEEIDFKISTQGVTVGEHFYHWNQLDSFWIHEKDGFKLLSILTHLRFPAMLILPINEEHTDPIKKACAKYLPYQEIAPKSFIDKWAETLQKHFPLENTHR